jgi:hypothetical protein
MDATTGLSRAQLLERIDGEREALLVELRALGRPMQSIERWQQRVRAVVPLLPGLAAAGAAMALLLIWRRGHFARRLLGYGLRLWGLWRSAQRVRAELRPLLFIEPRPPPRTQIYGGP